MMLCNASIPPIQTQAQKTVTQRVARLAPALDEAGRRHMEAALLEIQDDLVLRCPSTANMTAEALADRLIEEVRTAEITHTFLADSGQNNADLEVHQQHALHTFLLYPLRFQP